MDNNHLVYLQLLKKSYLIILSKLLNVDSKLNLIIFRVLPFEKSKVMIIKSQFH